MNLYFVSPKTGKAVSKEGSGKFAPKLLLLPRFLGGEDLIGSNFNQDIIAGLKITSYFFKNKLLISINDQSNTYLPNARNRLIEALNSEGIEAGLVHLPNDIYSAFKESKTPLPGTRAFSSTQISLPCGWWLTAKDCEFIGNRVLKLADQLNT